MAGIQALVNQKHGAQGNPNYVYYKLAAKSGAGAFHGIAEGDIDVNCSGTQNCFGATNRQQAGPGGLWTWRIWRRRRRAIHLQPIGRAGLPRGRRWNFAIGLGSIDVGSW